MTFSIRDIGWLVLVIGVALGCWRTGAEYQLDRVGRYKTHKVTPVETIRTPYAAANHPWVERDGDGFYWTEVDSQSDCKLCHKDRWTQAGSSPVCNVRMEFWKDGALYRENPRTPDEPQQ